MKFVYLMLLSFSLSAVASPFQDFFGNYRIEEIECYLNGEVEDFCREWKSLEIKLDPIGRDRVCIFLKKAHSTSSDCYKEEDIVSENFSRKGVFTKIPNGEEFSREIITPQIEKNYHMRIVRNVNGSFSFEREDLNTFPQLGQKLDGTMKAILKKIK